VDVKDFGLRSIFIRKNKPINIWIQQGGKALGDSKISLSARTLTVGEGMKYLPFNYSSNGFLTISGIPSNMRRSHHLADFTLEFVVVSFVTNGIEIGSVMIDFYLLKSICLPSLSFIL